MIDSSIFSMMLEIGLNVALEDARSRVESLFGLRLSDRDDLELGGAYYEYTATTEELGLEQVRVRVNHVEGIGWSAPHRTDVAILVEVGLRSRNLLDLGSLASAIEDAWTDRGMSVVGYTICGQSPVFTSRCRLVTFADPVAGAAHWHPATADQRASATSTLLFGGPTPPLRCTLTIGVAVEDLHEAAGLVQPIFGVLLSEDCDDRIGGRYLVWRAPTATASAIRDIAIRPIRISEFKRLYPSRQDCPLIVDITLDTRSLLDLGRLAAALGALGALASPVAYHVFGDMVADRVPRFVETVFESAADGRAMDVFGAAKHQHTRIYATRHGCEEPEGALDVGARLLKLLGTWHEAGRITAGVVVPLLDENDLEDFELPDAALSRYLPVPPPFVYCTITYDTSTSSFPTEEEAELLADDFHLELVSEH